MFFYIDIGLICGTTQHNEAGLLMSWIQNLLLPALVLAALSHSPSRIRGWVNLNRLCLRPPARSWCPPRPVYSQCCSVGLSALSGVVVPPWSHCSDPRPAGLPPRRAAGGSLARTPTPVSCWDPMSKVWPGARSSPDDVRPSVRTRTHKHTPCYAGSV